MKWIEGVERRSGALGVIVSSPGGDPEWQPPDQLHRLLPSTGSGVRRKVSVDLRSWTVSSAGEYLGVLGDSRVPSENHTVFSFWHEGDEYLVPAIVVIDALMRPLPVVGPYLFRPSALELVSAPVASDAGFAARVSLSSLLAWSPNEALCTWAWAYPSARSMWGSVYAAATQGKLCVELPSARIEAVLHGRKVGRRIAVSELRVYRLAALDAASALLPHVTNDFTVSPSTRLAHPRTRAEERLMAAFAGVARPLTDEEWRAAVATLTATARRKRNPPQRQLLDSIILKRLTGAAWATLPLTPRDQYGAKQRYLRWKESGAWDSVCDTVASVIQGPHRALVRRHEAIALSELGLPRTMPPLGHRM